MTVKMSPKLTPTVRSARPILPSTPLARRPIVGEYALELPGGQVLPIKFFVDGKFYTIFSLLFGIAVSTLLTLVVIPVLYFVAYRHRLGALTGAGDDSSPLVAHASSSPCRAASRSSTWPWGSPVAMA